MIEALAVRPVTDHRHVQQLARIQHRPGKEPSEATEWDFHPRNLKNSKAQDLEAKD